MISRLKFVLSVALRHLSEKKKQTILVIAGIAIGAMVLIVTFALANGIMSDIQSKIIDISPLITIKGEKVKAKERLLVDSRASSRSRYIMTSHVIPDEKKEIRPYIQTVSLVDRLSGVDAVSPYVFIQGIIQRGAVTHQCIVKGIIPEREAKIGQLKKNVVSGSLAELEFTSNGILLGSGLAKKVNAKYHQIIRFTGGKGELYNVVVVGTFTSGFSSVDDNNAFINLRLAQTIAGISENAVSGIGIHTTSLSAVNSLSRKIEELTGYKTETWEEANKNLLDIFQRNNRITFFLVVFVFVVAGFGISNVLITIVLQKQKDIAVMKSMGVSKATIEWIFLVEGLILGTIGALTGCAGGHYLTNLISSLPVSYGQGAVVRSTHIVTVQKISDFLLTGVFSILVSALSSLGPARRAARLNPVDILRA
ncbi:MAG: ABC transporter permease [Candidatus Kryptoniota bacterium]